VVGCQFQQKADAMFGDQHFKTAIALVELHKLRHGAYPADLADLEFTGDWDRIALASVQYRRLGEGYELNVTRGWVGEPKLSFPPQFFRGLGVRRSNAAPDGALAPATDEARAAGDSAAIVREALWVAGAREPGNPHEFVVVGFRRDSMATLVTVASLAGTTRPGEGCAVIRVPAHGAGRIERRCEAKDIPARAR
jgi:hypothetical protein